MKGLYIAASLLLLAACSPRAVRCDGALRPINAPAPRTASHPAGPAAAPAQPKGPAAAAQKGLRP